MASPSLRWGRMWSIPSPWGSRLIFLSITDKQSLQFTMSRVIFEIFGAMAKDSYLEISSHIGIYPLEQSTALRGDKFLKKYNSSDNYLCCLIAKH